MNARDGFAREALALIPKILTLQDRNRLSPTYGCFDRNFWHYKIIDFPSGMAQEFVWPLALAHTLDIPDNAFYQADALREWVRAGILYAARSAHPDGSCDDYFPYEKAGGAAAFSLLAGVEAYRLMGFDDGEALAFFERRAGWLAGHHESGRLTNHQALIVLCMDRVSALVGTDRWREARERRLARVLEWQHEEGWFQEYEGADPGYHTLTVSLLAQIYENTPSPALRAALERAVQFASEFMHPDGSYGGEYASRNTYNYFPHGFEVFGRHMPEALTLNDRFLAGLAAGRGACHADDHILGHHAWNYLLAWRDFVTERQTEHAPATADKSFPGCGLAIKRTPEATLYVALNKGGTFRFFSKGECLASDTGPTFQTKGGGIAVTHLVGDYEIKQTPVAIEVSGRMGWSKHKAMTPLRLIALRAIMLSGGKFFPDLVRKLLQKVLITGKSAAPFAFRRKLTLSGGELLVRDEVRTADWNDVEAAAIGVDQTSIYVVMSRTFQSVQLLPWTDLTHKIRALKPGEPLVVERRFGGRCAGADTL
jgi:hypothetical protein